MPKTKKTPARPKLTEIRWQAVLDTARDAIISMDTDGAITLFNRAAEEIFGYRADEVLGQHVGMLMPAPYRDAHDGYVRRYQESGEAKAIGRIREVEGMRKNGEVFPIELAVSEARAGRSVIYTAIIRDVSQRRSAEEALRRERDLAERLIETAQAIVLLLSPEGAILRYNSYMEKLSGRALATVQGQDWFKTFLPEGDHAALRRVFLRALSGGEIRGYINPIITASGELRQIEWYASALRDVQGEIIGILSIGQDITEQLAMIESLRDSEARFASFMDHLPGVAFMKNLEGDYVYVNRTFEELFGSDVGELIGKRESVIWGEGVARHLRENDHRVIETGSFLQTTEALPHRDGLHQWWVNKFPILDKDGKISMVAGVAVDITERVQAEEALQVLQRATQQKARLADIGAITAQIAHDLGNPLAAVSMQAQLILRRIQRDDTQPVATIARAVERMFGEVNRLTMLIREFLEFSREQRLTITDMSVEHFLTTVIEAWRPFAAQHDVAISLRIAPDLPPLQADIDKLRRVFDNLVRNAIEAIEGSGNVILSAAIYEPGTLRLKVEDSGSGISERVDVFRLFETTKSDGTGLGLPIAKQIVQAHGGRIDYANVEPRGTVFFVDLPCPGTGADFDSSLGI